MNPQIACPHCGALYKIPLGLGGKKAKCGACRKFFKFPSVDKLTSSVTAEPIYEMGPFFETVFLEPPPIPIKPKKSWFPSFGSSRFGTKPMKPLFRPKIMYYNVRDWAEYAGGYLPRITLLVLVFLGIFYLLSLPSNPRSPYFFTSGAMVGLVILCLGFQDDDSILSNIMSIFGTIFSWATTMAIGVIPALLLLLMFLVNRSNSVELSPQECGTSFVIIVGLFFLAIAITGAFMQYGFFRPAAVFFVGFCLAATTVQDFYHNPFNLYAKLYANDLKEQEKLGGLASDNSIEDDLDWDANHSVVSTPEPIEQILLQLASVELAIQQKALAQLTQLKPVEEERELVCSSIVFLLKKRPELKLWKKETIEVLAVWMTPVVSEELVQLIEDSVAQKKYERVILLARIPDDQIAATIVRHWQTHSVPLTKAIHVLGSRAEEPLWEYLSSKDRDILVKTCALLVQVGTEKSIPKLLELFENSDLLIVNVAKSSIKNIKKNK